MKYFTCEHCEQKPATIRIAAMDVDGTLLDSHFICAPCAKKELWAIGDPRDLRPFVDTRA